MRPDPPVLMVGVHHGVAPLEALERARPADGIGELAPVVAGGALGAVGVVTCHRMELYLEGASGADAERLFRSWRGGPAEGVVPVVLSGEGAARHLLRVAAGLEAAVLGDDQVLGQLRQAYRAACEVYCAGPLLHRLFHAAFRAGKRVRAQTELGRGGRSLAGEAVAWIGRRLGGLAGRTVLVLGAGEMGALAARRLAKRGAGRILVANRSRERAVALARAVGGEAVPWRWREQVLGMVDAVVVATAAREPVIGAQCLAETSSVRDGLVAVDLSVPRNLAVPEKIVPRLELADVERLTGLLERERARREASIRRAEEIVEEELDNWLSWVRCRGAGHEARRRKTGATAV